ncbi:hypothetical protein BJ912DRAFT_457399 [Pholiota molesta]|nr:hypothetical protein BJ912DRAFT_457399 [Pholiota molesta]
MSVLRSISIWPKPIPLTLSELPYLILGFIVESLLYGVHLVIFFLCVRVLLPRRRKIQRMMLGAVVIMFLLATFDVAVSWRLFLRHTPVLYTGTSATFLQAVHPKIIIHLINNLIADCLLLIRCYVVWARRRAILYIAGSFLCVITVMGVISEGTTSFKLKQFAAIYTLSSLVWTLVITSMTAGKIIWISREVSHIMGPKMMPHYQFAVAILVESGMMYTISSLLVLILIRTPFIFLAAAIVIRLSCIVPILIIVQIALGRSIQDVQRTVTRVQGDTLTQQIVLDTIISTAHDQEEAAHYTPNDDIETSDPSEHSKNHSLLRGEQ